MGCQRIENVHTPGQSSVVALEWGGIARLIALSLRLPFPELIGNAPTRRVHQPGAERTAPRVGFKLADLFGDRDDRFLAVVTICGGYDTLRGLSQPAGASPMRKNAKLDTTAASKSSE